MEQPATIEDARAMLVDAKAKYDELYAHFQQAMAEKEELRARTAYAMAEEHTTRYTRSVEHLTQQLAAGQAQTLKVLEKVSQRPMPSGKADVPYPKFAGEPTEEVSSFLFAMENALIARGVDEDRTRIAAAVGNMQGAALSWARAQLEDGRSDFEDWDDFKARLAKYFTRQDLQFHLRDRLAQLKQHGTVEAFTMEFRAIIARVAEMSDTDKVITYIRGLRPQVASFVREKMPKDIAAAIEAAHRFEGAYGTAQYQGTVRDEQADHSKMDIDNINVQTAKQGIKGPHGKQEDEDEEEADVDINAFQGRASFRGRGRGRGGSSSWERDGSSRGRGGWSRDRGRGRGFGRGRSSVDRADVCYKCGGQGHHAKQCPSF